MFIEYNQLNTSPTHRPSQHPSSHEAHYKDITAGPSQPQYRSHLIKRGQPTPEVTIKVTHAINITSRPSLRTRFVKHNDTRRLWLSDISPLSSLHTLQNTNKRKKKFPTTKRSAQIEYLYLTTTAPTTTTRIDSQIQITN